MHPYLSLMQPFLLLVFLLLYGPVSGRVFDLYFVVPGDESVVWMVPDITSSSTELCRSHFRIAQSEALIERCKEGLRISPEDTNFTYNVMYISLDTRWQLEALNVARLTATYSTNTSMHMTIAFYPQHDVSTRDALLHHIWATYRTLIPSRMDELTELLLPEFNDKLHGGSAFIHEVHTAAKSESDFAYFKSKKDFDEKTVESFGLWVVFFHVWYLPSHHSKIFGEGLQSLCSYHAEIASYLPLFAAIDGLIGHPETTEVSLSECVHVAVDESNLIRNSWRTSALNSIHITPVQVRYALELAALRYHFGDLSGQRLVEIGGGYGGMGVTIQTLYDVDSYSIVDLSATSLLQRKYTRSLTTRLKSIKEKIEKISCRNRYILLDDSTSYEYSSGDDSGTDVICHALGLSTFSVRDKFMDAKLNYSFNFISPTHDVPLESDILFSFFAISELKRSVVDTYFDLYVRHAQKGYFQLNFDNAYTMEDIGGHDIYTVMQMFEKVYSLHASAILLPPPIYHRHYRIVWGSAALPVQDKIDLMV